ncbi:MAG: hypothetical protein WA876_02435, partial [Candidatus Acidiferrales bacterium]
MAGEAVSRILYAANHVGIAPDAKAEWRSFLWALDHSKGSMRPTRGLALGNARAILRGKSVEPRAA